MRLTRATMIWIGLAAVVTVPIVAAAASPLLQYRSPIYIAGGLAGILGMTLMFLQPLLAAGYLPGLSGLRGRQVHRRIGAFLVLAVVIHVGALWITSPPDVIDALLFASPTPFSAWGVIAMWAVLAAALLAVFKRRLRLRPRSWRLAHRLLAAVIVVGTVVHALLIEGTMETVSKVALCAFLLAATVRVVGMRRL